MSQAAVPCPVGFVIQIAAKRRTALAPDVLEPVYNAGRGHLAAKTAIVDPQIMTSMPTAPQAATLEVEAGE
jgi:hypothetical protein